MDPGAVSAPQPCGNRSTRARRTGDEHPPRRRLSGANWQLCGTRQRRTVVAGAGWRPDGSQMVRGERRGPAEQAEALGISLAEELLDNGARDILAAVYDGEAPR